MAIGLVTPHKGSFVQHCKNVVHLFEYKSMYDVLHALTAAF